MKSKKNLIGTLIVIIIMVLLICLLLNKDEDHSKADPKTDLITKDEAYNYLKEFYTNNGNDIIVFKSENDNEYIFELKGSCRFSKCEYHLDKKTKEVMIYTEE